MGAKWQFIFNDRESNPKLRIFSLNLTPNKSANLQNIVIAWQNIWMLLNQPDFGAVCELHK